MLEGLKVKRRFDVGVAINPNTAVFYLKGILKRVDAVTVMTVDPAPADSSLSPDAGEDKKIRRMALEENPTLKFMLTAA